MWLGKAHRLHWGLCPTPAAVKDDPEARLQAFRDARDELRRRLALLLGRELVSQGRLWEKLCSYQVNR